MGSDKAWESPLDADGDELFLFFTDLTDRA
jgi:hypothetical protein